MRPALPPCVLVVVAAAGLAVAPAAPAHRPGGLCHHAEGLASRIDAVLDGPDYKHASWGALVVDANTGDPVYSRNPDALLAPASVTKLFSCAAALVAIGPDHTYQTTVHQRGVVFRGVLRGDLILVAGGDLTLGGRAKDGKTVFKDKDHTYANSGLADAELTDADPLAGLNDLARQVKAAGITRVDGDVLIDDRLFARARGSGSGPDLITPIVVNDNVIDITVTAGAKPGDPATVTARPESAAYHMDAVVSTGVAGGEVSVELRQVGPNQFTVRGRVPAGGKPQVRIYPVEEPVVVARTLFVEALRRAGVGVVAAVLRPGGAALPDKRGYDKLPQVAALASPPLKDVVAVTLKVSHNLYASTLPSLMAVKKGETTADAGLRAAREVWAGLGVDVSAVSFAGGAGGATADRASARATVQLLQGMRKRPEWEAFKAGLPILGVDGTLSETVGADSPARGKAFAKTGTLTWFDVANGRFLLQSKALAGVMTTKGGRELLFAVFVNNVPLPKGVTATREGKALGRLCEILYEHGPDK